MGWSGWEEFGNLTQQFSLCALRRLPIGDTADYQSALQEGFKGIMRIAEPDIQDRHLFRPQKRRPTMSLTIRSSVLRVRPNPTPKLNSHFGEKLRSSVGKS